jgi:NAD(P)H dehydrogenase (quinone)
MKVLIIVAHHRPNSLTGQIKENFEKGLKEAGHESDTLDLHKIGWNPVLAEEDEPDYSNRDAQVYSEEVKQEHARILQYDAIAFAFPTYWWGMPAILKGYLDRVFNYNFAYGSKNLIKDKIKKLLWLTLMASDATRVYDSHRFNDVLDYVYNVGVGEFCQIESSKVVKFVNVKATSEDTAKAFFDKAYKEGLDFNKR